MYFQKKLGVSWTPPKEYSYFKSRVSTAATRTMEQTTSSPISSAEFKKRAAKRDGQRMLREQRGGN